MPSKTSIYGSADFEAGCDTGHVSRSLRDVLLLGLDKLARPDRFAGMQMSCSPRRPVPNSLHFWC